MQAGIIDVDKWLSTDPDANRVLNLWEGRDRVIPLDDPWQRSAMTCMMIDQSIAMQAAGKYEIRGIEDFMPPQWVAPPKVSVAQSPEEQRNVLDSMVAVRNGQPRANLPSNQHRHRRK